MNENLNTPATEISDATSAETTAVETETPDLSLAVEDTTFVDETDLSSMNYVELSSLVKDLKANQQKLLSSYEIFRNMKAIYKDAEGMKEAFENAIKEDPSLEADRAEMEKFAEDSESYEETFKTTFGKFERSIAKVNAEINDRYGNVKKTMSFWDDQTLEYLSKVKAETEAKLSSPNITARETRRYLDTIQIVESKMAAMDDRFDLKFWLNRSTMCTHVKRIEKMVRKDFTKALNESMKGLHAFNAGIDSKTFMNLYVELARIIPGICKDARMTQSERNLAAILFIASIAKVGSNPSTVMYSSRLLNMIFSMSGKLYDYEGDHDEAHMSAIIDEILFNYLNTASSNTKKMYERFEYSMKKNAK